MSGELSNWDILDFCKKQKIRLDGGVVMKDQLGTKKKNYTIINLESSSMGNGTHWTCLMHQKAGWFFFDSYGVPPSQEIIKYVNQFADEPFAYNSYQIQHYDSTFCGWYCLGLICFVNQSPLGFYDSINEFLNMFDSSKRKKNDDLIESYVKSVK